MFPNIPRLVPALLAPAVAGLLLAGCGGSDSRSDSPAAPIVVHRPDVPVTQSATTTANAAPTATDTVPGATAAPSGAGAAVEIAGYKFGPQTLTVPVGTTVTWTNNDDDPHTVTAKDGSFRSDTLHKGSTYQHTFDSPGTYTYLCSIHPFMVATVVVTK